MPLKGIKVLELAGLAPAPFCGMILSDFGASVLRVDRISSNTDLDCLGHGKQSIALNLKDQKGIEIFRKLCSSSDVLLEPFRKGVMESLGLGPSVLMELNPKLIYARLTGFGQSGPYSNKAGHDINFLAMSGLLSLFGRKNEKPTFPVNTVSDFGGGGLMCALGILLALIERGQSGKGQIVDNNMVNGTAYLGSWLYRSQNLPIWGQKRGENVLDSGYHFYEVYETKDGKYLSVGSLEPQFYHDLLKGLGLSSDDAPQYDTNMKEVFSNIFKEKDLKEWLKIFENLDACVAPVLSIVEAPLHPHNIEQEAFYELEGKFHPSPAPKLSRTPGSAKNKKVPEIGEHTQSILRSLNYSDEQISELERNGCVGIYRPSKL
ncbi:alpha-methylacyl-CoA racemase [Coccinella septempunctata]|uniref:alpha-methylacyl-CoA racemase n=1 Tax=Coccinella septempunctata TaxID=41139 RepID=UPI001D06525B|nr:alpha-methylacyl-CoA racemase [Coccinella septempunctata]